MPIIDLKNSTKIKVLMLNNFSFKFFILLIFSFISSIGFVNSESLQSFINSEKRTAIYKDRDLYRNPLETLTLVNEELERKELEIVRASRIYTSIAFPNATDPKYLNGCFELNVDCKAHDLLKALKMIERKMGRSDSLRWSSRVCDLDLLSFSNMVYPNTNVFNKWYSMPFEEQMIQTDVQHMLVQLVQSL
mgnify:CR=1 FL=1